MIKLLNFALVFVLSIVNFMVMLVPLALLLFPFLYWFKLLGLSLHIIVVLAGLISGYMLLYMILDSVFGFTVKQHIKGAIPISQAGFLNGHADIVAAFDYVKKRFNLSRAELYITQDMQVNAYAVGSFRKKAVIMTLGLIHRMHNVSETPAAYLDAVKGIIGHEMSHLANKDFLPGILVYSNEVAHRFISRIIRALFMVLASIFRIIPRLGATLAEMVMLFYRLVDRVMSLFYKMVFKPFYGFLYKAFSRSIEYRCDKDSAKIFGGKVVAYALSVLGKGAYFSIFSTHPATKSRMKHVESIHPNAGVIKTSLVSTLANCMAVGALIVMVTYSLTYTSLGQWQQELMMPLQHQIYKLKYLLPF